jgi:exodeoxyribonuclease V alpha subunit
MKQGNILITNVISGEENEIIGTVLPFQMENRILPNNLRKNVFVRVEGYLKDLTKHKKILVITKVFIESPESRKKEFLKEKGIDVSQKRNEIAQNGEITIIEFIENGGSDSELAKELYTQEIAALHQLLEAGRLSCDIETIDGIRRFFQARAVTRGYETVHEMIASNPWVLAELDEFPLRTLQKAAPLINPGVARDAIIYAHLAGYVWSFTRRGHSYAPLADLSLWMSRVLSEAGVPQREHRYYIASIATSKTRELPHGNASKLIAFSQYEDQALDYYTEVYRDLGFKEADRKAERITKGIYLVKAYYSERDAAELLAQYIEPHCFKNIDTREVVNSGNLDEEQKEAILNALNNRLSIINGHAGTGKTHTVAELVRFARANGLSVIMLAPSAMAANNAASRAGIPVDHATIHRIARILPSEEDYGEDTFPATTGSGVINEDIVIVDEMSMCNICTFSHLLHSMKENAHTHLVLVGDTAQLPAIGPSGFFHQLVRAGKNLGIPVVTLEKQHRNDSDIYRLANAIRRGDFPDDFDRMEQVKTGSVRDLRRVAVELKNSGADIKDILFLSPVTSASQYGTSRMNEVLREVFNPNGVKIEGLPLFVGDPVVAEKNDYADAAARRGYLARCRHPKRDVDVYNGMRGRVVDYDPGTGTVIVEYYSTGGDIIRTYYTVQEVSYWIDTAYALTVHKAQGSEAEYVVFVNEKGNLSRNMLYTALTRARTGIWILGQEENWKEAVSNPTEEPLSKFIFRLEKCLRARNIRELKHFSKGEAGKILFGS